MSELKRLIIYGVALFLVCFFYLTPLAWAQNEGEWFGATNEGKDVYFEVSSDNVENFIIEICVSGGFGWAGGCFEEDLSAFSLPVSGDNFSYSSGPFDLSGSFTSSIACTGTWTFNDGWFGYGSGTWSAGFPASPHLEISPSNLDFGNQLIDTASSTAVFSLINKGGGTATGSISLTGTNADQFEITGGAGSFSLSHGQSKDVYVRFAPTSESLKTATLAVDGDPPGNDESVLLTGTGTDVKLSVTPNYQAVPSSAGSAFFTVAKEGSGTLSWFAERDSAYNWLAISSGSSGSDSGTISVSFDDNDGEARTGSITVTADGAANSPQLVELLQASKRPEWKLIAADGGFYDDFGSSVDMSGDFVIVGAPRDDDNGNDSGSAYVFERTENGWIQRAKLTASDGAANDNFGVSVGISGDYAIVGAHNDDDKGDTSGSAYVFEKPAGGWVDMTETAKLTAGDGAAGDRFGFGVSISGDYAVAGAAKDDDSGSSSGSAYVFERTGSGWVQEAKLIASDAAAYDDFGHSVSMSGDDIIVGSRYDNNDSGVSSGSAYVFEKPSGGWADMTETAKLTAGNRADNAFFAASVSISGNYAVVGAWQDNNNENYSGSAYVFEKPVGGWTDMTETAKLKAGDEATHDYFGASVSIFEDYVIVGADEDDDKGVDSGSVYVFEKPANGWTNMTETFKLIAGGGTDEDRFGCSVGIFGDYVIAGARGNDGNGIDSGSAYIYLIGNYPPTISNINDQIINKNTPTSAISFTVIDSETLPADLTLTGGSSNSILVPNENIVFGGSGTHRTITVTPAPDETGTTTITVTVGDGTNTSNVSFLLTVINDPISDSDGDNLIDTLESSHCTDPNDADTDDDGIMDGIEDKDHDGVVDPGETDPCAIDTDGDGIQDGTELGYTTGHSTDTDVGTFQPDLDPFTTTDPLDSNSDGDGLPDGQEDKNHNGMVDDGESDPDIYDVPIRTEWKLTANDGASVDRFGDSVSISGDYAIVGAWRDDYNGIDSGSAYIFKRTGEGWIQLAKLTASDAEANDTFGISVGISGDYAVIGARFDDDNGIHSGSAYIFEKPVNGWADMTETAKLTASDGVNYDQFGHSVSISGDGVIVGAYADYHNGILSGSAYVFEKPAGGWINMTETAKLSPSDGAASDHFGFSVSISGDNAVVGARQDDDNGDNSGSAYVFEKPAGGWINMTETAKLTASDGEADDNFGHPVSISGNYCVVGARSDDDNGSNSGSAYIFAKPAGGWINMAETAKLTASDGATDDYFGMVSISGENVVAGARNDDDNGIDSGSAYIFAKPIGGWTDMTETAKLTAGDGASEDYFGYPVGISEDFVIIGAVYDDDNGLDSGSAYIYPIGNIPPTISDINNQTIDKDTSTGPIDFTIADSETSAEDLTLTGISSNNTLVPNENIVFGGSGTHRTVTVTPASDETGTTTITITVSDGVSTSSDSFILNVILPDADADGLPDTLESSYCTDPNDADTDDDGILDGVEDEDHDGVVDLSETDPCAVDTDGDGIQDGTELGYTTGHPTDTDLGFFQPDLGPSTTTDPLNPYSDDDCLSDGEEDTNHNGIIDAGESNPNIDDQGSFVFERMWPTLQQPWYFMPLDMASDIKDNIYLLDIASNSIQKYTSDGKFLTKFGKSGSGDGEFRANGIAVDSDGFIYVADTLNYRIQKFTSDGGFITKWGDQGNGDGQFDLEVDENGYVDLHNQGIAVDDNGFVYVADMGNHRIQKFTSNGEFVEKMGRSDGAPGAGDGEFNTPTGLSIDKSGFIYVSDSGNHRVQKLTLEGQFIDKWGSYGNGDLELNTPEGLAVGNDGFVYVADSWNQRVLKFTSDGVFAEKWGRPDGSFGNGNGEFYLPMGMVSDTLGFIYISDFANNRLQKFTTGGSFMAKWGSIGSDEGEFQRPTDVAIDSNGFVCVVDTYNHRIQRFAPSGQLVEHWGGLGSADGQFEYPENIAIDNADNIYVADTYNHRIQKFRPVDDGNGGYYYVFDIKWGSYGSGDAQFYYPMGIAADNMGYIYVVEYGNHRVQKFTADGEFIAKWTGTLFDWPSGISVDSSGYVYVTDRGDHPLQKFTPEGNLIMWVDISGGGDYPGYRDIDIDGTDTVYITNSQHQIKSYTSDLDRIAEFGGLGYIPGKFSNPDGLCLDPEGKLYVADTENNRVQVFKPADLCPKNKAIIISGGGPFPGNYLWDATQMSANFAYRAFTYQGYGKESIFYLTSNTDLDLDSNGVLDDVDGDATNSNLEQAITTWAANANSLVVYLVDHGGNGTFRMSGSETLSASDLDSWLDTLQGIIPGKVVVVYDACESGSFLSALTPPSGKDRVVITSTSPEESAYFITQGSISFSNYFWTHIFNGVNIKDAFDLTKSAMTNTTSYQNPLIDADGNGVGNEPEDRTLTQDVYIGNGTAIYGDAPVIGSVSPDQTINGTSSALLYAENVTDDDGIARVWAVIRPPDYNQGSSDNPVQDLPLIDLLPVGGDRYEKTYENFNIQGTYQIAIYARDRIGNTSIPQLTTVSVENPLRRRAIITMGGLQTDPLWPAMENSATLAYEALTFQGYTDDDIYFMSPITFSSGVDGTPTLSNFSYAVNTWAQTSTQDVVLYLIGYGGAGTFELNSTETLSATDLDTWLDSLQNTIPGKVTVVYDACQSGSFLSVLIPPSSKERILLSSSGSDEPAYFLNDGDISFSTFFWRRVLNGTNVRDSFLHAKNAMEFSCQGQTPHLDDNGNGVGNEKIDGSLSRFHIIGAGIMLAGDEPLIGSICPEQTVSEFGSATIWVENVTTTGTIDKVWAVIAPPDSVPNDPSSPITGLPDLELSLVGDGRYEGMYSNFAGYGTYQVSVYAKDIEGNISLPKETTICYVVCSDDYEVDDTYDQASIIILNSDTAQQHNFHDGGDDEGDEDWIKFFGITGQPYSILASNLESNCDIVLELYDSNGTTLLDDQDTIGDPQADELLEYTFTEDGIYYVKVRQWSSGDYGENTGYDLTAYRPIAGEPGNLVGRVMDSSGSAIGDAVVRSSLGSTISFPNGYYILVLPSGTHTITVTASGFAHAQADVTIQAGNDTSWDFVMDFDTDGDGIGDSADTDDDDDGMPDDWEVHYSLDPLVDDAGLNPDNDTYTNFQEYQAGSDPKNGSSYPKTTSVQLKKGFNLIAIPAEVSFVNDLRDWLTVLGDTSEIDKVMAYDNQAGKYETLIPEDPSNPSVILQGGEGLIVYAMQDKEVIYSSLLCSTLDLNQGLNLIGIACPPDNYTAFQLLTALGSDNVTSVQKYSTETGMFETAGFDQSSNPSGVDFSIVAGEGYFIYMKQAVLDFGF